MKLGIPKEAGLYFGVYAQSLEEGYRPINSPNPFCPADPLWEEVEPNSCDLSIYTKQATESFLCAVSSEDEPFRPALVHFWNDWSGGAECRQFPLDVIEWIESLCPGQQAPVPYISLNTRSHGHSYFVDPIFSLDSIIRGEWDDDLRAWAKAAAEYAKPLLVTWAPECNGEFKSHNAIHHGGPVKTQTAFPSAKGDHPHDKEYLTGFERFHCAHRHIVDLMKDEGANNIQWVLHFALGTSSAAWNKFENYHPGHDYVDWFGVSVYGATNPSPTEEFSSFGVQFDDAYFRIQEIDNKNGQELNTPIIVTEMGCAMALEEKENPPERASAWASDALYQIRKQSDGNWTNLKGFIWWNESWLNVGKEDPEREFKRSVMRVQENEALRQVFHDRLFEMRINEQLVEVPIIERRQSELALHSIDSYLTG